MARTARWLALSLLTTLGCGPDAGTGGTCTSDGDCGAGEACVDGACEARADSGSTDRGDAAGHRTLASLAITPADPTVVSVDGAMEMVDFEVEATWSDGTTSAVGTGFWSITGGDVGAIDPTSGVFTANGELGGVDTIEIEVFGSSASTTITVHVERSVVGDGAPADAAAHFGTPAGDASRQAGLLYPFDGVVFPENVYPPDVQWERGDAGDLYRVTLTAPYATLRGYVAHSGAGFGFHWAIPRDAWHVLADSSGGEAVTLVVDRWIAASDETIAGAPRTLRFARASITGAIYYWDLTAGRILRIRGDGTGRESFMPSPPPFPDSGVRCVACHTISRDGRRMAVAVWNSDGAIYDLTADLTGDPPPAIVAPTGPRWRMATFNPDATRLLANYINDLFLLDARTGARLTPGGTPLPTTASGQPAWSPDGTRIAYVANHDGPSCMDFTMSDLAIIPVTGPDEFGPSTVILEGGGRAIARPSWSPDSEWIAVQDGVNSRSINAGTRYPAHLRLVRADGAGTIALEALDAGLDDSYYPTFSPFDEGGYFWLAFFSTRDYGNAHVGTRGTGRRQLWVSAIARDPVLGEDPSHPPYWLPQQDLASQNTAAFWTEEACRADGRSCAVSSECCSGFCRDQGAGPVCVPPDVPECSMTGEACRGDDDCCEGTGSCVANICTRLK